MFIDIHTHNEPKKHESNLSLLIGRHALGLHPWELTAPFELNLYRQKFRKIQGCYNSQVLAIGECGLDRRREGIAAIELQEKVLEWHLDWAQAVKSPIIIHCVRAQSDLLKVLKSRNYDGKIILHDYAGNLIEAEHFLSYDCYFSFGKRLFDGKSKAASVFASLPIEKIFLETGDQHEYSIEDIYQRAALISGQNQTALEGKFYSNLVELFSDLDNISTADLINNLRFT